MLVIKWFTQLQIGDAIDATVGDVELKRPHCTKSKLRSF